MGYMHSHLPEQKPQRHRRPKCFVVAAMSMVLIAIPYWTIAQTVTLEKYICETFLADLAHPEAGESLLRSMMAISWATGYVSASSKSEPRGDSETMGAVATVIAKTCQTIPKHRVIAAATAALNELLRGPPIGKSATSPTGPLAPGASRWVQGGSIVQLKADGASRKFFYEAPSEEMRTLGAAPGALLFEGRKDGVHYVGKVYVFAKGCKPESYAVVGDISADEKQVTLRGKAPQRDATCRVSGERTEALVFEFQVPHDAQ